MEKFELYSECNFNFIEHVSVNVYHWKAPYYKELETKPEEVYFDAGEEITCIIKEIKDNEVYVQLENGGMVWLNGDNLRIV
jgi:hypothetical protein